MTCSRDGHAEILSIRVVVCRWRVPALGAARAEAQSVTLAWDPNSEPDLAGYLIGYGTAPGQDHQLIDVGGSTAWTLYGFSQGRPTISESTRIALRGCAAILLLTFLQRSVVVPRVVLRVVFGWFFGMQYRPTRSHHSAAAAVRTVSGCLQGFPPSTGSPSSPAPAPSGSCGTPDPFAATRRRHLLEWRLAATRHDRTQHPAHASNTSTTSTCCALDALRVLDTRSVVSLGGGTCSRGGWLPPGMAAPAAAEVPAIPVAAPRRIPSCHSEEERASAAAGVRQAWRATNCITRPIRSSPSEAERARNGRWLPPAASCPTRQASLPRRRAIAPPPIRS